MAKRMSWVLCLVLAAAALGQTWQSGPVTGFAFTRFDGEYFPGTGKVYFLGGRLGGGTTDGSVWSYDPETQTYADVGVDMPKPVSNYDICLLRDDYDLPAGDTYGLYIVGGRYDLTPNYYDSLQVYYPVSNRVVRLATDNYPGRTLGQISVAMNSAVYDNKMYVCGGFSSVSVGVSRQTFVFDPLAAAGSRWAQIGDMVTGRCYVGLAVVDSWLIAAGGDTFYGTSLYARNNCQKLNLNDTGFGWTACAAMPGICGEARAFGFDTESPYGFGGKLIIAGRGTWSTESANCYIYDAATDDWDSFPRLNNRRRNHAGVFIPGDEGTNGVPGMWVFGGRQNSDTFIVRTPEYYQLTMTGVSERPGNAAARFALAPNPAVGVARVSWPTGTPAEVSVFDVRGALVQSACVPRGPHVLRGLVPGVYVVRVETAGRAEERKLVVSR
jgi:hypothetical protein